MEQKRITIDPSVMERHNMTIGEFIITLAALWKVDLDEAAHHMVKMGTARVELGLVLPNQIAVDRFYAVLADSTEIKISESDLQTLAGRLKLVYPRGKQPNTDVYWTEGVQLIAERLRNFFRKYGEFPANEVVDAAKRYVEEMSENPFMKTLKYFIYKDTYGPNGTVEYSSDLYTYIENKGQKSDAPDPNWTGNLR